MAVADLPQEFLERLTQDPSVLLSFEAFKQLLLTTDDGFGVAQHVASARELSFAGRLLRWLAGRVQCGVAQAPEDSPEDSPESSPRLSESDSGHSPTANQ